MCRRHVQHGSPQDPNMLKTLTNNYLGHPGDAWCNLQHQAHQGARNQGWQNFSNRLSSWDMRPQYLDSACQNASIYVLSLCSNSTICRSTQGKTCELVSRTRERSTLRPENHETPKSSALVLQNIVTYPPPTHTFLKRRFLTDFEKHTHTPPKVTTFWCIRPKVEKTLKKCENAPCWHEPNVPERYAFTFPTMCPRSMLHTLICACQIYDPGSGHGNASMESETHTRSICKLLQGYAVHSMFHGGGALQQLLALDVRNSPLQVRCILR